MVSLEFCAQALVGKEGCRMECLFFQCFLIYTFKKHGVPWLYYVAQHPCELRGRGTIGCKSKGSTGLPPYVNIRLMILLSLKTQPLTSAHSCLLFDLCPFWTDLLPGVVPVFELVPHYSGLYSQLCHLPNSCCLTSITPPLHCPTSPELALEAASCLVMWTWKHDFVAYKFPADPKQA